jgi:hypothetical protein
VLLIRRIFDFFATSKLRFHSHSRFLKHSLVIQLTVLLKIDLVWNQSQGLKILA